MARSSKKPPFIDPHILKKVFKGKKTRNLVIVTRSRRSLIVPDFVGLTFSVYNGKSYIPVTIKEEMVGYKLGEFAPTRTFRGHGADKKVVKKK